MTAPLLLLATLGLTHLPAAMSPGPSFIYLARAAAAPSCANGIAAALDRPLPPAQRMYG
jgi:threonine/homoserine/homoserine lactone efflux protein